MRSIIGLEVPYVGLSIGLDWTRSCLMKIMHMMKPCIDKAGSVQHE